MTGLWTPPTLGGEGTCAPSPWAGQESAQAHDAHGMGQRLVCPPRPGSCPVRGAVSPGCVPRAVTPVRLWPAAGVPAARAGKRGQLPDPQKVFFCSSRLPSPPKEAAEILLSPVLLHLSCKNRKNPTVLTGTSPASEPIEHHRQVSQIFLLQQEKKKIN